MRPVKLLHIALKAPPDLGGQRQRQTVRRAFLQGIVEILDLVRHMPARHEVPGCHTLPVLLKDGAVGEPAFQRVAHSGRVATAIFDQKHGFGNRADRDGHDGLIGQLCQLPRPGRADVNRSTHRRQDILRSRKGFGIATGHDGQRSGLCAFRPAGHRRIEVAQAEACQIRRLAARLRRFDRRHLDPDRIRFQRTAQILAGQKLCRDRAV